MKRGVTAAPVSKNVLSGSPTLFRLCPKCGAKPGWRCYKLNGKYGKDDDGVPVIKDFRQSRFHDERRRNGT